MYGINNFSGEYQAQNNHVIQYYRPLQNKSVAPSEKVAPSYKVENLSATLDDIKDTGVTIYRKYLDNKIEKENMKTYQFQGQSARSTR